MSPHYTAYLREERGWKGVERKYNDRKREEARGRGGGEERKE